MIKLVKTDKDTIYYRLNDAADLNAGVISKIQWPATKKTLDFRAANGSMRMVAPVKVGKPWQKYGGSVIFFQQRDLLAVPPVLPGGKAVSLTLIRSRKLVRDLYVYTQDKYFVAPWRRCITSEQMAASSSFRRRRLPHRVKAAQVYCGGKRVGMVAMTRHKSQTLHKLVNTITWVWVDEKLPVAERSRVHSEMIKWVKQEAGKIVCAHVNTFNLRSQGFFIKMGFKPARIYFYR